MVSSPVVRLLPLLLIFFPCASLPAQKPQEQLHALTRETQKQGNKAGRVTVVWWMIPEFWRAAFASSGVIPMDKIEEFTAAVRDINVFAIVDGKVSPFGAADFVTTEELRKNLTVVDGANQPILPLAETKQSNATKNMLAIMKPIFANMLGEFGKNLSFFVFEGKNKDGSRRIDPTKPGGLTVKLNGEEFHWRLPLGSLLAPKVCPKCNQTFPGDYAFCPFDATVLKEAAKK